MHKWQNFPSWILVGDQRFALAAIGPLDFGQAESGASPR